MPKADQAVLTVLPALCLCTLLGALDAKVIAIAQPAVVRSLGVHSRFAPWLPQVHLISQLAFAP